MNPILGKYAIQVADYFRGTEALNMFREYLESEWYSAEEIHCMQVRRLRALVNHAYRYVPYYQALFKKAGVHPCDVQGLEDLRFLPVTTKATIRADSNAFFADNIAMFKPNYKSTGGSTGEPLHYCIDRLSKSAHWAFLYRSWSVGGWLPGDRMVVMGGASVAPSVYGFKKYFYRHLNNWMFLPTELIVHEKMNLVASRLKRFGSKYMYGYSSCAFLLAEMFKEQGIDDVKFDAIFTTSEVLHDRWRALIEEVFSCKVYDTYGGPDGAGFANECEEHNGLHYVCEDSILEIVDDQGNPVPAGCEGHVVSTSLLNYAMPFIRYDVGDMSAFSEKPCLCGRNSPVLKRIQGRDCDFVEDREGHKIYNGFFSHIMHDADWISGFHVLQETHEELFFYLRPNANINPSEGQVEKVRQIVQKQFKGMEIKIIITQDLPRLPNGKFKYVLNKLPQK